MFKVISLVVAMVMLALAPVTARAAASSTLRLEGEARSSSPSLKFKARYEEETTGRARQRLDVQIENVQPGSKHVVLANGKPMGAITANSFGRGELHLRVNWDGTNVPSLPHFKAGDTVTVDKLNATLVRR